VITCPDSLWKKRTRQKCLCHQTVLIHWGGYSRLRHEAGTEQCGACMRSRNTAIQGQLQSAEYIPCEVVNHNSLARLGTTRDT